MRIDKFLKVSRVLKRRATANEACSAGKVFVNGKEVKPSREVKEGDVVEIKFGEGVMKFRVNLVKESVKKEDAPSLYTIL
ncbi:MAG: RNA-binding S4 domain-containing protein [Clostridia bacterium]|nr:RNA-binding S4 domain-containing protein [Clostridia bacterium]